jgi:nitrogen fixation protein FixH
MRDDAPLTQRPREITGRTVLIAVVTFFAVVTAVNFVMVRFALSTFGGVEVESAYKAGLAFSRETAAARAQDARKWQVDAKIMPRGEGALIEIAARDAAGRPLAGYEVAARLAHPTDRQHDRVVAISEPLPGTYRGAADAPAGQWYLVIDIAKDQERLFRSKSRVLLR